MSAKARTKEEPDGPVLVILKPDVLKHTSFRPTSPEYAMLQQLAQEPHPAYFEEDDQAQWCRVEGKPRILARCFDIVGQPAMA